ncbi:DUF6205 family protein [Streptomyces sp. NPDC020801]|uniref:DUF6205 family protein n=1 Tax=Streptomyces sp. NPDC020801 TaxID=3365093 RepID=UPI0037A0D46C
MLVMLSGANSLSLNSGQVSGGSMANSPRTWVVYPSYNPSLVLRVSETSVDTDKGPLLRRTATALVMREIDEYRERGLVEQVQRCIDLFPGHAFTGRLECEGEENTDIWRVVVRDGRALRIEPRIVWPGEEGTDA